MTLNIEAMQELSLMEKQMTPEQEAVLFHYELGQATSYWAFVEMGLRHLVSSAVTLDARHLVSVGFISIENFRSKLSFCDNIVTEHFHRSPHYNRWQALHDRVKNASSKRNQLAHRTVMLYSQSKPGRRHALINWNAEQFTAPSKATRVRPGLTPPSDAMCVREIVGAKHEFEAITLSLANLRTALLGGHESSKELEVAKNVPTVPAMWKQLLSTIK